MPRQRSQAFTIPLLCVIAVLACSPILTRAEDAAKLQTIVNSNDFRLEARPEAGAIDRSGDTIMVASKATHPESWALQIQSSPMSRPVSQGEAFCVSFDARSIAADTQGDGEIHVLMAKNDPWEAIDPTEGFRTLNVPSEWLPFRICFRASHRFAANEIYAGIQCATKKQRLEIRDLKLIALGNLPDDQLPVMKLHYPGKDDNSWHEEAAKRIAKHRQSQLTIRVVDAAGRPIPDATVKIEQQKHAYAFGTFVGNTPIKAGPDAMRFRQQTKAWFNRVTLPRYWADWGTDTPAGQVKADATAEWAAMEGFELKTHLLLYPQFIPDRVKQLADRPSEFKAEIEAAMDEALRRTRNLKCVSWDATNELRDVSLVGDVLGNDYYASVFNRGNRSQPDVLWFINEYGIFTGGERRTEFLQTYIDQIRQIQNDGGAVEGIGIQGHFQSSLIPVPEIWKILDRLGEFGLPIEITEFDIDSRDEDTQAQYTRDVLTAVFSHPATTGFTTWGFWEGDMWRPSGAMFRTDWTIKPNGKVWEELILKEWWTSEVAQTNAEGVVSLKAFNGVHKIKAEAGDSIRLRQIELNQDSEIVLALAVGE